ncbi:MAG: glucose 1-dehydrogenase [Chloroflexi bacterium]|nr:glucose 1-dehydrogenase [Chloroflexota bacterium]
MRLEGKVALISGGARGMGAAEARLFAGQGAAVVIGDVLEEEGRRVEAEIVEAGGRALFVRLDVTIEADWTRAVAETVDRFGALNVLVNNAAILRTEAVLETTEETWDSVMSVNAKGVFLGTKAAIPEMRRAGGGSIVNISSGAGITGSRQSAAYHASKGAVRIFTKAAAVQYAPENIRVNSVHPGPIDTDMLAMSDPAGGTRLTEPGREVPLGRPGRPEEVAYGVLYLASDESSYVTGSELVIDGGRTAQ